MNVEPWWYECVRVGLPIFLLVFVCYMVGGE